MENIDYISYIGDYTTQLYRDYAKAIIRIPINQPGFHGMKLVAPLGEILPGKAIQVPSLLAHSFRWYWPGNREKLEDGM